MTILKVSSKSNPNSVAGAIAGAIRENGSVELQAIGAGAVNQTVKAVAIARGYTASGGTDLRCIPAFSEAIVKRDDDKEVTAIKFIVLSA